MSVNERGVPSLFRHEKSVSVVGQGTTAHRNATNNQIDVVSCAKTERYAFASPASNFA